MSLLPSWGMLAIKGPSLWVISKPLSIHSQLHPTNCPSGTSDQHAPNHRGAARAIFEFLDVPEETETQLTTTLSPVKGEVEFANVSFGYNPELEVIHNFSLHVEPGMKVAIVGPTGAGKTTLVKLLMRFYELNSGMIKLDGLNIAELAREDLRSHFGMVLQDAWLFNGTIRENIRYGRLDATDEEVVEPLKRPASTTSSTPSAKGMRW